MTSPEVVGDLAVVLATIRPDEAEAFLESLLTTGRPGEIVVVVQGDRSLASQVEEAAGRLADRYSYARLKVVRDRGHGISRARNLGVSRLDVKTHWVWMPNDTVRVARDDLYTIAAAAASPDPSVGAIVGRYVIGAARPRSWNGERFLAGWDLFAEPAEPATLWQVHAFQAAGGFDERLGTGGPSIAQAMEGSDLHLRLQQAGWKTATSAELVVRGTRFHSPRDSSLRHRKSYFYGVGFGVLARRYGVGRRGCTEAIAPLLTWLRRSTKRGLSDSLAISAGRLTGLILGDAALSVPVPKRYQPRPSYDWIGTRLDT